MARLLLPFEFDLRAEEEAVERGCLSHARVELDDGRIVPVSFIDPRRLSRDLQVFAEMGRPWFAEVGLIVVPEVVRSHMTSAIEDLARRGFFEYFRPIESNEDPWNV